MRRALLSCGVLVALVAAGCGNDSSSGGSSGSAIGSGTHLQVPKDAKQGGSVTFLAAGDIDYLDPVQDYYTFGFMVQYSVNRPLYSYKPADPNKPIPDL